MAKTDRFKNVDELFLEDRSYEIFEDIFFTDDNIKDKVFKDISNDINSKYDTKIVKILEMYYDQLDPQNKIMFKMLYLLLNKNIMQLYKYIKEKTENLRESIDNLNEYKIRRQQDEELDDLYDSIEEEEEESLSDKWDREEEEDEEFEERYKDMGSPCSNYGSRRS